MQSKELVNKKHPFESLRDPATEEAFNQSLLNLLQKLDYAVITVAIDKLEHNQRYEVWRFDPYHYCLTVMAERYVFWLKSKNAVGDVMAESRSSHERSTRPVSFVQVRRANICPRCTSATAIRRAASALEQ